MIKRNLFILVSLLYALSINAQQPSVEKSVSGVQLGFMSVWGYHEIRLSDKIALRAEGCIGASYWYHSSMFFGTRSGYAIYPVFAIEPRYYCNLNKRSQKQKRTDNNSANFLALNVTLDPGLIITSSEKKRSSSGSISFIPTWGIRRNIGKHFDCELGLGLGYEHIFNSGHFIRSGRIAMIKLGSEHIFNFRGDLVFRPHLRIGYHF